MPTLFRLLLVIGVLAGLAYGAMLAMVTLLAPQQRDISETIALPKPGPAAPARSDMTKPDPARLDPGRVEQAK